VPELILYAPNGKKIIQEVWTQEVFQTIHFVPEGEGAAGYVIAGTSVNATYGDIDTINGDARPTMRDGGKVVCWVDEDGDWWASDEVSFEKISPNVDDEVSA